MNKQRYDTVIIGGGPAGYSAALYCARSALSVLVLEKLSAGGQMATQVLLRITRALRKASTALIWEKRCSSRQSALVRKPDML